MTSKTLRVVSITNNLGEYPECAADTDEFPQLVKYLGGNEMARFVVDPERPSLCWPADEFFLMEGVSKVVVDSSEIGAYQNIDA